MSLDLVHACHVCHSFEKASSCSQCHTTYYCSRKCQQLDWKVHKNFCLNGESKEQAVQRRNLCYTLIQQNGHVVLYNLFKQQFVGNKICLYMKKNGEISWESLGDMQQISSSGQIKDTIQLDVLAHELSRETSLPALAVMHQDEQGEKVFLFNSAKFTKLHAAVTKIPAEMLVHILELTIVAEDQKYGYS